MFKLKINFNMEKILSITRKLGISFYALLSAAASSKFIQSTKVVLIKFCAMGVVQRLWMVIRQLGIIIGWIIIAVGIFATIIFGFALCVSEVILFIPYCLIWILTGKFYCGKIFVFINEKTILFDLW